MKRVTSLAFVILAAALAACGPETSGDDDGAACTGLVAGELVISEIMANPDGEDNGKEWFEIYNAGSAARELAGLTLVASRADGSSEKTHVMATLALPAGGYVVVGGVLPDVKPAYVSYGYGSALGSLLNTSGKLALRCGAVLVDDAVYDEMTDGKARGFSGAITPDYLANDDLERWCDGTEEFIPGSFGTPGGQNESCGSVMPPGMCDEGGTLRPTVTPVAGDLVISEIMQSPDGTDGTAEWFEVHVARDVDLNGLEIGKVLGDPDLTLAPPSCARVTTGSYLVFGRSIDAVANAGLPAVDFLYSTGLSTSGSLVLAMGGVLVDQIVWASAFTSASSSLDPDSLDELANDDPNAFCKAVGAYGTLTNKGTPGAANPQCPLVVPAGMCDDGGVVRAIVSPLVGQLVISEFLADTLGPAAENPDKEWFEVVARADFDLNGLELGKTPPAVSQTLASPSCLEVTSGTLLLFAGSDDPLLNGGLPVVSFVKTFGITNSASGLYVGIAATVIDAVTWSTTTAGASTQLDPDVIDAAGNDVAANLCVTPAASTYGAEGYVGTPGAVNVQCP